MTKWFYSFLLSASLGSVAHAQTDEQLRSLLWHGHRNSREAINSLHAMVTINTKVLRHDSGTATRNTQEKTIWKQQKDRTRYITSTFFDSPTSNVISKKTANANNRRNIADCSIRAGELTRYLQQTSGKNTHDQALIAFSEPVVEAPFGSPWSRGLFVLLDRPFLTLADALGNETTLRRITSVRENNRLYYLATFHPLDGLHVDVQFDPSHNFLANKRTIYRDTKGSQRQLLSEEQVLSYTECLPGIFFPNHIHFKIYNLNPQSRFSPWLLHDINIEVLSINNDIPSHELETKIPSGVEVHDARNGTVYTMGKDGRPASKPRQLLSQGAEPARTDWNVGPVLLISGVCLIVAITAGGRSLRRYRRHGNQYS